MNRVSHHAPKGGDPRCSTEALHLCLHHIAGCVVGERIQSIATNPSRRPCRSAISNAADSGSVARRVVKLTMLAVRGRCLMYRQPAGHWLVDGGFPPTAMTSTGSSCRPGGPITHIPWMRAAERPASAALRMELPVATALIHRCSCRGRVRYACAS